jgi:hypothetical protein
MVVVHEAASVADLVHGQEAVAKQDNHMAEVAVAVHLVPKVLYTWCIIKGNNRKRI